MSWGEIGIIFGSFIIFGAGIIAGLMWALGPGTDPDRPMWQPMLMVLGLVAWFVAFTLIMTKLTIDGVIMS